MFSIKTFFRWLIFLSVCAGLVTPQPQSSHASASSPTAALPEAQNVALVGHLGGSAKTIFVQGNYAYAGFGPELAILDVSDPSRMVRVGYLVFGDSVADVTVSGDTAFVNLGPGGLAVVDVTDPTAPAVVAALGASTFAGSTGLGDLVVSGDIAYVCDATAGLWMVDISDRLAPSIVGYYPDSGTVSGVALAGNLAYLAGYDTGLVILDVSNPAQPVKIGAYRPWGLPPAWSVAVSGNTAYVGGTNGLWLVDVSDPAQPSEITIYQFGIYSPSAVTDLAIAEPDAWGHRLVYLATGTNGLVVADVTDPAHPAIVTFSSTEGSVDAVAISAGYIFVTDNFAGIQAFSAPVDPHSLAEIGSYDSPGFARAGVVVAGYDYLADGDQGLRVIDVADPQALVEIGSYTDGQTAVDVAVGSLDAQGKRYAYLVEDSYNDMPGLRVLDVSDPAVPVPVGFYPCEINPTTVAMGDDDLPGERYIYLIEGYNVIDGQYIPPLMRILDVSDPAHPVSVGTFSDENGQYDIPGIAISEVDSQGRLFAYLTVNQNVDVVEVTDPTAPQLIASVAINGATDVALEGSVLYVSSWEHAVTSVDVSDPGIPIVLGFSGSFGQNITVVNQRAYVQIGGNFYVYDVTDPAQPTGIAFSPEYAYPGDIAVDGGLAYIADGPFGLHVLTVSGLTLIVDQGTYGTIYLASSLVVEGGYVYTYRGAENSFEVVDIHDRMHPDLVGSLPLNYQVFDLAVGGSYAYLATLGGGLQVVDVADPANPILAGAYDPEATWTSLVVSGTYAYLGGSVYSTTLDIVDLTEPQDPLEVGRWENPEYGGAWNIALSGQTAYVTTYTGLHLIDVSDPAHPWEASSYPDDRITGVAVDKLPGDPYLYIAEIGGLRILDLSDPANPQEVAFYNFPPNFTGMDIALGEMDAYGHRNAVLAGGYAGVLFVDITDPAHPLEAGYFDTPGNASDLAFDGSEVFLADGESGLSILRFTGFSVEGWVRHANGWPYPGVTLDLGGVFTTTSGLDGYYAFGELPPETYALAPRLESFTALPVTRSVNLPPNGEHQDFTILARPVTISLLPGLPASLVYTDTQGLPTRLDFPPGAISQTLTTTQVLTPEQSVTVTLTPTLATAGSTLAFTGHAFELGVARGVLPVPGFVFSRPVTATIAYNDLDAWVVSDPGALSLELLTPEGWVEAGQNCSLPSATSRDLEDQVIQVVICQAGKYALFGPTHPLLLPFMANGMP